MLIYVGTWYFCIESQKLEEQRLAQMRGEDFGFRSASWTFSRDQRSTFHSASVQWAAKTQLHYSRVHKITLQPMDRNVWGDEKNTPVWFSDERICTQVRAAPETSACVVFPEGWLEPRVKTNKQTAVWELSCTVQFCWEETIFSTSLSITASPFICPRPRGNILSLSLSLGVSGKRKKDDVIHFQMKEREE